MPQVLPLRLISMELRQPPSRSVRPPMGQLHIMENRDPSPSFYRYLYQHIGQDVGWTDRLLLQDHELKAVLDVPTNELHVLYVDGNPCGFAELDLRRPDEVEVTHIGLLPEYRGQRLGKFFFNWMLHQAWRDPVKKFRLIHSEWDHPAAFSLFSGAGFVPTEERIAERLLPDGMSKPNWQ